jgi:hypothetical protein
METHKFWPRLKGRISSSPGRGYRFSRQKYRPWSARGKFSITIHLTYIPDHSEELSRLAGWVAGIHPPQEGDTVAPYCPWDVLRQAYNITAGTNCRVFIRKNAA